MRFLHDHNLRGTHWGICLLGLLAFPLLAGCGGGGGGSNGNSGTGTTTTGTTTTGTTTTGTTTTGTTTGTNTGTQPSLTVSAITATGLTASITESSSTVAVNGSLTYTLTLTNNTAAAVPIHATSASPTAPSAGLVVKNASGAITFEPLPPAPPLGNASLAVGQSLTTTQVATGFAAAGVYSATATFSDDTTAAKSVGPLTVTVP